MQKNHLKIGFIGGGINSVVGNTHKIASQMDGNWKLESGCFSRHESVNIETAEKWEVSLKRTYSNWREFLKNEKEKIDAVAIITPSDVHAEMIIEALNKNNGFLAVTYNYTGYPMLREIKNMIEDGKIGKVWHIQIEMPQEGFARLDSKGNKPKPQEWRLRDGVIPTISLDLGVHVHSIIEFLTGEKPIEVIAEQSSYGHFNQVCDNIMCIAKYTREIRAQIWYSKSAIGNRNGLKVRVYGEKGA